MSTSIVTRIQKAASKAQEAERRTRAARRALAVAERAQQKAEANYLALLPRQVDSQPT